MPTHASDVLHDPDPDGPARPAAPESARCPVPLSALGRGRRAMLHDSRTYCDECELLAAMGLTQRCTLRVCRAGEPFIVQVGRTRLGIPAAVARTLFVVPGD